MQTLTNLWSYLFAEQITSSFLLTNTLGNFCKKFYFFCSVDTKQVVPMSGTPLFNKTNVNNTPPPAPQPTPSSIRESLKWIFRRKKFRKNVCINNYACKYVCILYQNFITEWK